MGQLVVSVLLNNASQVLKVSDGVKVCEAIDQS